MLFLLQSVEWEEWYINFRIPVYQIAGGAVAISPAQFKQINGFSNNYWGWGYEDDNLSKRYVSTHVQKVPVFTQCSMFLGLLLCVNFTEQVKTTEKVINLF